MHQLRRGREGEGEGEGEGGRKRGLSYAMPVAVWAAICLTK